LRVDERVIKRGITNLVQNRVSIDRFTGGARDTALFNERPLFGTADTNVCLSMRLILPTAADETRFHGQIGLLLLLLKDVWTGDLPFGGEASVGRGRLRGERATLALHQRDGVMQRWTIAQAEDGHLRFEDGKPDTLEQFVSALGKGEA
jgi:hypothetical protein